MRNQCKSHQPECGSCQHWGLRKPDNRTGSRESLLLFFFLHEDRTHAQVKRRDGATKQDKRHRDCGNTTRYDGNSQRWSHLEHRAGCQKKHRDNPTMRRWKTKTYLAARRRFCLINLHRCAYIDAQAINKQYQTRNATTDVNAKHDSWRTKTPTMGSLCWHNPLRNSATNVERA